MSLTNARRELPLVGVIYRNRNDDTSHVSVMTDVASVRPGGRRSRSLPGGSVSANGAQRSVAFGTIGRTGGTSDYLLRVTIILAEVSAIERTTEEQVFRTASPSAHLWKTCRSDVHILWKSCGWK